MSDGIGHPHGAGPPGRLSMQGRALSRSSRRYPVAIIFRSIRVAFQDLDNSRVAVAFRQHGGRSLVVVQRGIGAGIEQPGRGLVLLGVGLGIGYRDATGNRLILAGRIAVDHRTGREAPGCCRRAT
jgi:hypothetical protein